MKKFISAGLILLCLNAHAQKVPFSLYYADSLLSETPYQYIDTSSQITTGILWDRIIPNLYLPSFTGNPEDTVSSGLRTSFQPAMDLRRAAADSSILPGHDSLTKRFQQLALEYNALPLMLYHINYNMIKETAFDDNLISLDSASGNFVFGPGAATSAFEQETFFALGFRSSDLAVQDTLRFVLPSDFYFNNTQASSLPSRSI